MTGIERDSEVSRRVGNRAVNRAQDFLEENDLIFERVDQRNDIGIDAILTLARRGRYAGRSVNLQIKGGSKYKRKTHVDEFYSRYRGQASFRSVDWRLQAESPRGYEGHHIVDADERLRKIWRNSRPIYVIVQDPDDQELYFGNLARMMDVLPLDQETASTYARMSDEDGSRFYRYLASVQAKLSGMSEDELRHHKTWMPLYPDLRLTPDGLDRFVRAARAEAEHPIPDPYVGPGPIPIYVTYRDGTVGPSREALDAMLPEEEDDE